MAENTESPYATGVYVKGDDERVANTPSAAVALVFDGFKLKEDATVSQSSQPVTEAPKTEAPKPSAPRKPASDEN